MPLNDRRATELFDKLEWLFKGCDPQSTGMITRDRFAEIVQVMELDGDCRKRYRLAICHPGISTAERCPRSVSLAGNVTTPPGRRC